MGPSGVSSSLPTGNPHKGAYPGRHRGRPLRRDRRQQANPGERAGTEPRPYRSSAGPMHLRHGPYGTKEKPHRPPWPATQSGASASRMQGMGGNAAKIIPPRSINLGQSLSRGLWPRQLPLHKGALPCGGRADTQVRPYAVIGVRSNPRWGGTEPAPYRKTGADQWRRGVVTPPYGSYAGSAQQRADAGIGPYGRTGDTAPLRPSK